MKILSLNTDRVRRLLVEIRKRSLPVQVCLAEDVIGPGGGVYVKARTPVTTRHIAWFESRNPASGSRPTFMEVEIRHRGDGDPADVAQELDLEPSEEGSDRRARAREAAEAVGGQAKKTARVVRSLHQQLDRHYTPIQLSAVEVVASLKEFEREVRRLHQVVRVAIDDFLGGNALVMDFIVDYDLERPEVRHAVRVSALATELRIRSQSSRCDEETFRRELAHLFVAGFLHDAGMWNEPYCFPDGHEARGAALARAAMEDVALAERVERLVLFHSDWQALAGSPAVGYRRVEDERMYDRAFVTQTDDAGTRVLSDDDRCAALALALAERWVTDGDEALVRARTHRQVLDELVRAVGLPPSSDFVASLCNMEIECVAPRRALVKLTGAVPMHAPRGHRTDRYERTKIDGFAAGSLGHGDDAASPHLITLFAPGAAGRNTPLAATGAGDPALWERRGEGARWYVPAGRYRSLLSWEVTGILSTEEYETILAPYEERAYSRGVLPRPDESVTD